MPRPGTVYILASHRNGTLYVGVTSNLERRLRQHQSGASSFTQRYGVYRLIYVERYPDIRDAIRRERQLKRWKRLWKVRLIEAFNPDWRDLAAPRTGSRSEAGST